MWLDYRYGSAINYDSDRFHTVPRLPGDGIYAIDLGMVLICATDPPPRRVFCFQTGSPETIGFTSGANVRLVVGHPIPVTAAGVLGIFSLPGDGSYATYLDMVLICANDPPPGGFCVFRRSR